jgi:hypothetical protein
LRNNIDGGRQSAIHENVEYRSRGLLQRALRRVFCGELCCAMLGCAAVIVSACGGVSVAAEPKADAGASSNGGSAGGGPACPEQEPDGGDARRCSPFEAPTLLATDDCSSRAPSCEGIGATPQQRLDGSIGALVKDCPGLSLRLLSVAFEEGCPTAFEVTNHNEETWGCIQAALQNVRLDCDYALTCGQAYRFNMM